MKVIEFLDTFVKPNINLGKGFEGIIEVEIYPQTDTKKAIANITYSDNLELYCYTKSKFFKEVPLDKELQKNILNSTIKRLGNGDDFILHLIV
jgi:hypothetical protein